jgi:hypothetical protein
MQTKHEGLERMALLNLAFTGVGTSASTFPNSASGEMTLEVKYPSFLFLYTRG